MFHKRFLCTLFFVFFLCGGTSDKCIVHAGLGHSKQSSQKVYYVYAKNDILESNTIMVTRVNKEWMKGKMSIMSPVKENRTELIYGIEVKNGDDTSETPTYEVDELSYTYKGKQYVLKGKRIHGDTTFKLSEFQLSSS